MLIDINIVSPIVKFVPDVSPIKKGIRDTKAIRKPAGYIVVPDCPRLILNNTYARAGKWLKGAMACAVFLLIIIKPSGTIGDKRNKQL